MNRVKSPNKFNGYCNKNEKIDEKYHRYKVPEVDE